MSTEQPLDQNTLKLFRTSDHTCSYLPNQQARTLFIDPDTEFTPEIYERLTHSGFRRSGPHLYRPDCRSCRACIPSRVNLELFKPSRRFRRVIRANSDLRCQIRPIQYIESHYQLFERYINLRHADGDMYPANRDSYRDFLMSRPDLGSLVELRLDDRLMAVSVTDRLESGLSAIYTFFEPEEPKRSLGTYAILNQINIAREQNLPYLYMGYWVPGCQKMHYKSDFQPIEMLIEGHWQQVELQGN